MYSKMKCSRILCRRLSAMLNVNSYEWKRTSIAISMYLMKPSTNRQTHCSIYTSLMYFEPDVRATSFLKQFHSVDHLPTSLSVYWLSLEFATFLLLMPSHIQHTPFSIGTNDIKQFMCPPQDQPN